MKNTESTLAPFDFLTKSEISNQIKKIDNILQSKLLIQENG